jgi:hypothetical protein
MKRETIQGEEATLDFLAAGGAVRNYPERVQAIDRTR